MAYTFTDDFLAQLRNRCDIEDIIGRYVQLKKTGSSTVGLCRFFLFWLLPYKRGSLPGMVWLFEFRINLRLSAL